MTTRSRWRDWTPPQPSNDPPKPTEGTFVGSGGASVLRSHNSNPQCSLEVNVNKGSSLFSKDREADPPKPTKTPTTYFDSRFAPPFADLTGTPGSVEDLRAIEWAERNGWPDIVVTLRKVDRRCEALAADDDEEGFRHAVVQLIGLFRAIRAAYAAHLEAVQ